MPRFNFKKAIESKPPYHTGWHKSETKYVRLLRAIASRPSSWSMEQKVRSAGRALTALANVTKDPETKRLARADAKTLFSQLKGMKQ